MYHFAALWSSFHIHNHYLLNSPNTSEKYRKTLLKTEKSTESCWALSERGVDLPEEQEKGHRRRWLPSSCWTNSGPSEEQSVLIQRRTCFLTLRNKLSSFQLKKKKDQVMSTADITPSLRSTLSFPESGTIHLWASPGAWPLFPQIPHFSLVLTQTPSLPLPGGWDSYCLSFIPALICLSPTSKP